MGDPTVELEDEDFLSQVAEALSAKRRKFNTPAAEAAPTAITNLSRATTNEETKAADEGIYTAALRGSRSVVFQQQISGRSNGRLGAAAAADGNNRNVFANPEFGGGGGRGGGSCFKCGKPGHWARDCDSNPISNSSGDSHDSVPEKACPCGLGNCIVLTANTEKNRGRKFYKCHLREENGGCGFFEWCDKNEGTNNLTPKGQSHGSNPSIPDLPCPCGAGACLILTAKTGKNIGQAFYKCPANQGSCGFFKWCHDQTIADNPPASVKHSTVHKTNEMSNKSFGIRSGSPCFKCGKDGHWAKDCLQSSVRNTANLGGK